MKHVNIPNCCRFARSVGSEEADNLPLRDFERDAIDSDSTRVSLGETFDFNHSFDR